MTSVNTNADERAKLLEEEKYWDEAAQECRTAGIDDSECAKAANFYRRQLLLLDCKRLTEEA